MAFKSRAKSNTTKERGESVGKVRSDACSKTTINPESGLKLLGLIRPINNKTYDLGLAKGTKVHMLESIKLCGLRKGK